MEIVPVYVGLDYHRRSVQVRVVDAGGLVLSNRKCGNRLVALTLPPSASPQIPPAIVLQQAQEHWHSLHPGVDSKKKPGCSMQINAVRVIWVAKGDRADLERAWRGPDG